MIGKPDDLAFSAIRKEVIAAWRFAVVGTYDTYVLLHDIRSALDNYPSRSCSQVGNGVWRSCLVARMTVSFSFFSSCIVDGEYDSQVIKIL